MIYFPTKRTENDDGFINLLFLFPPKFEKKPESGRSLISRPLPHTCISKRKAFILVKEIVIPTYSHFIIGIMFI